MRWFVAALLVRSFVVGCECSPSLAVHDAGVDAGAYDAGADGGLDAGLVDAGSTDSGSDAGLLDAGSDAGSMDAGFDAGSMDAGSDAGGVDASSPFDAGTLDLSFGDGGLYVDSLTSSDQVFGLAVQPDGKIVGIGCSSGFTQMGVFRLMADGRPDPAFSSRAFNLGTSTGDLAFGLQLLQDGGIVAVGTTLFNSMATQGAVVQLRADGSFETNFGASGPGFTAVPIGGVPDDAAAIVAQPDGTLIIGGYINPPVGDFSATRLLPNGQLDLSFNGTGSATFVSPEADVQTGLGVQANGAIVLSGQTANRASMVRFKANGAVDTTFGDGGLVVDDLTPGFSSKHQLVLPRPDGTLFTIGYGNGSIFIGHYDGVGARIASFGDAGVLSPALSAEAYAGFIDRLGRIVFAGRSGDQFVIGRVLANGTLDTGFGPLGTGWLFVDFGGMNQFPFAAVEAPNGQIVVGGMSSNRFAVTRLWP